MLKRLSALLALSLATASNAQQTAEPPSHPDWTTTTKRGTDILLGELFDPSSAQFSWISGYSWGFLKPILGKRQQGWIACGRLNAKNRMGGYVGAKPVLIFVSEAGTVTADYVSSWISTCDKAPNAAVQPELAGLGVSAPSPSPIRQIADELGKLAELRSKGILTDEEFQAEKAKLLAR